jgi:hypothetical protein
MKVKFHSRAIKFLEKLDDKDRERLRTKLKSLTKSIEMEGVMPFKELDIKRLEGVPEDADWQNTDLFSNRQGGGCPACF